MFANCIMMHSPQRNHWCWRNREREEKSSNFHCSVISHSLLRGCFNGAYKLHLFPPYALISPSYIHIYIHDNDDDDDSFLLFPAHMLPPPLSLNLITHNLEPCINKLDCAHNLNHGINKLVCTLS